MDAAEFAIYERRRLLCTPRRQAASDERRREGRRNFAAGGGSLPKLASVRKIQGKVPRREHGVSAETVGDDGYVAPG